MRFRDLFKGSGAHAAKHLKGETLLHSRSRNEIAFGYAGMDMSEIYKHAVGYEITGERTILTLRQIRQLRTMLENRWKEEERIGDLVRKQYGDADVNDETYETSSNPKPVRRMAERHLKKVQREER